MVSVTPHKETYNYVNRPWLPTFSRKKIKDNHRRPIRASALHLSALRAKKVLKNTSTADEAPLPKHANYEVWAQYTTQKISMWSAAKNRTRHQEATASCPHKDVQNVWTKCLTKVHDRASKTAQMCSLSSWKQAGNTPEIMNVSRDVHNS